MKDDYTTNSHYLTYTFLSKGDGRMYFLSLGVKGSSASYTLLFFFLSPRKAVWTSPDCTWRQRTTAASRVACACWTSRERRPVRSNRPTPNSSTAADSTTPRAPTSGATESTPCCRHYFRSTAWSELPMVLCGSYYPPTKHHRNTHFCRAVTSISSQRLLHKMTNSRAVFIARIHAR